MAYNMLSDTSQANYQNAEELKQNIDIIYNKYSSKIFAYNKEQKENYTIYNIIDFNQNHLKLYEYNIMDYKIDF